MKKYYYYLLFCLFITLISVESCSKDKDDDFVATPEIALNKPSLILEKGKGERLIASFTPADTPNQGHTWSSSAPNIASIDETGMVSAVDLGESIITVTALNGKKTAKCLVTVTDKIINVTGVSLEETDASMVAGEHLQLKVIIEPSTATNKTVTWRSSDNKVASVDEQGVVTAITEGESTITAKTNDGEKTASCKIKVRAKGVDISKPEVSDITSISAFVAGTIKPFGVKIQEAGICYSTSQSPTVDNQKIALTGDEASYTLINLKPSTTYYARFYAIVDSSVKYGDQAMFTTEVPVEISEPKVSSITTNTAYVEGTIKTFGLQTEETGICYSTSLMPTINETKVVLSNTNIAYTLNELAQETTYYVRIYAKIKGEVYYGQQGTFSTTGVIKTHFEPTDIYRDKITLVSPGVAGVTTINVCYGKSANPKITDNIMTATKGSDGKYHLNLTSLEDGTTYYIRAYNRNDLTVEYYDDEVSVQTIGKDFDVTQTSFTAAKSDVEYAPIYRQWYRLSLLYNYNIKTKGTYLVETKGGGSLTKTGSYSSSIYLEAGSGSFTFMRDKAQYEDSWPYASYYYASSSDIQFTNLDTKIRYHLTVKSVSFRKV